MKARHPRTRSSARSRRVAEALIRASRAAGSSVVVDSSSSS